MQLEDYFEFEKVDTEFGQVETIRIKGSRIDIEIIVDEFNKGRSPAEIHEDYPTRTLEEIYATITYYLHNREALDDYIRRGEAIADAYYQQHLQREPDEVTKRLRRLKALREKRGVVRE